jgi:hypothetical protein
MEKQKVKRLLENLNYLKDNIDMFGFSKESKVSLVDSINEINQLTNKLNLVEDNHGCK